jgi:hypothetical protein
VVASTAEPIFERYIIMLADTIGCRDVTVSD